MSMFRIIKIQDVYLPELMELFAVCFKDDHYYAKMFPDISNRMEKMKKSFEDSVRYCVDNNGAYGMFDNNRLIAFILFFDYQKAKCVDSDQFYKIFKWTDEDKALLYKDAIHNKIDCLGGNVIYLLSVGVDKNYRKNGIAGEFTDFMLLNYPNAYLVSDVSNSSSVPIYEKRNFSVDKIDDDYYFIKHDPKYNLTQLYFDENEKLKVAVPDKNMAEQIIDGKNLVMSESEIKGFKIIGGNVKYPYGSFIKSPADKCGAYIAEMSYQQLLSLQRYINLSCHTEEYADLDNGERYLVYHKTDCEIKGKLWNDELRNMIEHREDEWSVIPDIQVLIPIEYGDIELIKENAGNFDESVDAFLHFLDYRTHFEAGIPKGWGEQDDFSFKNRIERYYLGKKTVVITKEITIDTYDNIGEVIGAPAEVDIIVSVDKNSNCGVFAVISESMPFLVSHFMDNVIRNHVYMTDDDGTLINLFDYIGKKYGICKRGTSKIFITIPKNKSCLTSSQTASLLMSETIYATDEELGIITDEEILRIPESETGMGQYDRAFVCVHTNVLLQFYEHLRASKNGRLHEEAIAFFYIELLMFEEAAVQIAEHNIVDCLSEIKNTSPVKFLRRTLQLHKQYAKTIEFWDIQVNYPSSKRSVSMIRKAFKIDEQIERMKRDSEELQIVFETQRDIMDRTEASILNYIILFLTLVQGLSIIFPSLFSGAEIVSTNKIVGSTVIIVVILMYWLLKNHIGKLKK